MIINGFGGRGLIGYQDSSSWLPIANISVNTTFVGVAWSGSSKDGWSPSTESFSTFTWPDVTYFRILRLRIISNTLKCTAAVNFTSSISSLGQRLGFSVPQASSSVSYLGGLYAYTASYNSSQVTVAANTDVFSNTSLRQSTVDSPVQPSYSQTYGFLPSYDSCKIKSESFSTFSKGSSYCLSCAFISDFRYLYDGKTLTWQCNAIFEGLPY